MNDYDSFSIENYNAIIFSSAFESIQLVLCRRSVSHILRGGWFQS